jgi:hypothetical protein
VVVGKRSNGAKKSIPMRSTGVGVIALRLFSRLVALHVFNGINPSLVVQVARACENVR